MNYSMINYVIGRVLLLFGALMALPLTVAVIYGEGLHLIFSWFFTGFFLVLIALFMARKKVKSRKMYAREGFVIVAALWILLSFIGSLPLFFSGEYPTLYDAFFEIASGLTTTGATVVTEIESLSHSVLFWRSFTHLIGGMGVLVFALALTPGTDANSVHILEAEVPGPSFDKIASKLSSMAKILYAIYLAFNALLAVFLLFGGMDLFEALCHAFGTAGTGGFGVKNTSIAYYNSVYIETVLGIGMIVFGINFNLYYLLLMKEVSSFYKNEELRWYLAIIATAVFFITINVLPIYGSLSEALRNVFFAVSSIISTTGFTTADFAQWPLFSHIILMLLMFIGSSAGSTAGGLKVSRVIILVKGAFAQLSKKRDPRHLVPVRFNKKSADPNHVHEIQGYFGAYILLFILFLIIVSFDTGDFETAFSSIAATINNVGPGLGAVGPTGNYAFYSPLSKIVMSFAMIAGRLEIWPILILFSPKTWRRH